MISQPNINKFLGKICTEQVREGFYKNNKEIQRAYVIHDHYGHGMTKHVTRIKRHHDVIVAPQRTTKPSQIAPTSQQQPGSLLHFLLDNITGQNDQNEFITVIATANKETTTGYCNATCRFYLITTGSIRIQFTGVGE